MKKLLAVLDMTRVNAKQVLIAIALMVVIVCVVVAGIFTTRKSSSQAVELRIDKLALRRSIWSCAPATAKSIDYDECRNVQVPSVAKKPASAVLVPRIQFVKGTTNDHGRTVSELNDQMSALLEQLMIPDDYVSTMIAIFADRSGDTVVRDFAVQHIGLYAETRNRRGEYNPDAEEARAVRNALWSAADETQTIVAAAAFRALADLSEFDAYVDSSQLNAKLVSCVSDRSASPAARVMAAQLCGERRIGSARSRLQSLVDDPKTKETLRRAAMSSLRRLNGVSPR